MRKRMLALAFTALALVGGVSVLAQKSEPTLPPVAPPTIAVPPPDSISFPQEPSLEVAVPQIPPQKTVAAEPEDPMQEVELFVAENRKRAEDSIKALSQEAETLRARLKKVEAALERWKAVQGALTQTPVEATGPAELEPVQKK